MSARRVHAVKVRWDDLPDDPRLTVRCPWCAVLPGQRCLTPSGRPHYNVAHYAREDALLAADRAALVAAHRHRLDHPLEAP